MKDRRQHSQQQCYLCGRIISDDHSRDHVPPKQFFPEALRAKLDNLVTLPAHKSCNKSYEADEEYVLVSLGAAAQVPSVRKPLADDIRKKAGRPEGRRLLRTVLKEFDPRPGFLYLPSWMTAKTVDDDRFSRIMWKIARGLYFHHTGKFIPEATPIHIELCQTEGQISQAVYPVFKKFQEYKPGGACWDVFAYRMVDYTTEGAPFVWSDFLLWQSFLAIVLFQPTGAGTPGETATK